MSVLASGLRIVSNKLEGRRIVEAGPFKAEILRRVPGVDAPIRVLGPDGTEITRGIGATTFYLWNSGTEVIRDTDVPVDLASLAPDSIREQP